VQPIKELWSVAGRCDRRGCALIRQLANSAGTHMVSHVRSCQKTKHTMNDSNGNELYILTEGDSFVNGLQFCCILLECAMPQLL